MLDGTLTPVPAAWRWHHCLMARVEQHLPDTLLQQSLIEVVLARLAASGREQQRWQAERLLAEMGFTTAEFTQRAATLSGGQHTDCCWPER